jgi:hypothetical protein
MGPVTDRTHEHLGVGDRQIAEMRQLILRTIRDVQAGKDPPLTGPDASDGALDDFYLLNVLLPKGESWKLPVPAALGGRDLVS